MDIETRISEIYRVFQKDKYNICKYKQVSSKDYTSFLIFEKAREEHQDQEEDQKKAEDQDQDQEEEEEKQEKKQNCSSSLLWLVFFHDKPELMRVEYFNAGKHITELELFNKMEELAISLKIIREIKVCDDSRLLVVDSNGIQQSLRLDVLTVLCDGTGIWNQRGYTFSLLKQQIMDTYNASVLKMVLHDFITQLYYHINKDPIRKKGLQTQDLEDLSLKEFWNRPVKDFFCNIREKLKNNQELSIDFVLRLLNDIAEQNFIMVSGEFEYLKKKF
uniref:Uncharacterized protein n=1 Tax=viral metagenome TaxID=1070528 RepID=A0A6C0BBL1_9ZZZZ